MKKEINNNYDAIIEALKLVKPEPRQKTDHKTRAKTLDYYKKLILKK